MYPAPGRNRLSSAATHPDFFFASTSRSRRASLIFASQWIIETRRYGSRPCACRLYSVDYRSTGSHILEPWTSSSPRPEKQYRVVCKRGGKPLEDSNDS